MRIAILGVAVLAAALALAYFHDGEGQAADDKPTMTERQFWSIIESARPENGNVDAHAEGLRAELVQYSLPEIETFDAIFARKMAESYTWDLWGAAYVANGGASDDGFEYFRRWLIAQGEKTFVGVSRNPDSLADLPAAETEVGDLEAESIAYVAADIWAEKSGLGPEKMPRASIPYDGPSGTSFKEEPEHLSKRYPKLWKRFGS